MSNTHDFNDGNGAVPAHRHSNGGGWVAETAKVDESAHVGPHAKVYGNAWVNGNASIFGNAEVYGYAWVFGNAWVAGDAQVCGNAWVYGNAQVYGNAWVSGDAQVCGNARVYGDDNAAKIAELTRKLDALRNEVKAARILGASSPIGFEFARKQWEDAKQVTDTLNALEDER